MKFHDYNQNNTQYVRMWDNISDNICEFCLQESIILKIHSILKCQFYNTVFVPFLFLQLKRTPKPFPTLKFKRKLENIDDFTYDDFILEDYKPHPKITMAMAVWEYNM